MATETTKKPAARKTAAKKSTDAAVEAVVNDAAEVVAAEPAVPAKEQIRVKRKELDPEMYVTVRNGYHGLLIYKSSKTGEVFEFEDFGDEHDIELQELKKAKNDSKAFFENNWFLIDDWDVIEYLGLTKYYKDAFSFEEFEAMAEMTADEIEEKMKHISKGQKSAVAHYARKLIGDGKIDSMKAINALESGLGVQLIER